jgi:hypothetical protein
MRWALASMLWALTPLAEAAYPPPPAGYSWADCSVIGGALLQPKGWFFREDKGRDGGACVVSREAIEGGKQYQVGLVINLIRSIPTKKGMQPSAFGHAYVLEVAKAHDVLDKAEGPQGPFVAARIEHRSKVKPILHQYTLVIANDRTGSAFLVVAEAPEQEWAKAWSTLEPVVKKMLIDDEL